MTDRPDLDDPRVLALARARQQIAHEGMLLPTWDELTDQERADSLLPTRSYLHAALRAGLIDASPTPADDGLREQYAAAMREHYLSSNAEEADADGNMPCRCGDWREGGDADECDWDHHLAEAVLAVRDRCMEQLAAGRETWKAKAAEIEADRDRLLREFPWLRASDEDRQQADAKLTAVRALTSRYPVTIDTAHLLAALDGTAATNPTGDGATPHTGTSKEA